MNFQISSITFPAYSQAWTFGSFEYLLASKLTSSMQASIYEATEAPRQAKIVDRFPILFFIPKYLNLFPGQEENLYFRTCPRCLMKKGLAYGA